MDDDDFNYSDAVFDPAQFSRDALARATLEQQPLAARATVAVQNQPHDEEVALSESEGPTSPGSHAAASQLDDASADGYSVGSQSPHGARGGYGGGARSDAAASPSPSGGASSGFVTGVPGGYNPDDYAHLDVTEDVQDVFKYVGRFRPAAIELPTRLAPFIPEFIPAVGGVDEFIKVPRPDGRPDMLGLKVLDEPAAVQSDPALLSLTLRQLSKDVPGARVALVSSIPHDAPDRAARLAAWIARTTELHKSRPAAAVAYSRPMPDLEELMQEWPPELEAALRSCQLPSAELDLDLPSFAKLVCVLLDVPVHEGQLLESLHMVFSLVLEFALNPVFQQQLGDAPEPEQLTAGSGRVQQLQLQASH